MALAEVSGFASEWAAQREQRASGRAARAAREPDEVVDPEAQARRRAQREAAMADGLEELDRWLGDLVRQGMAAARRQPYGYWDAMAARLVDAQLPGLAERVRSVGGAVAVRDDWADHLLGELGRWHLAIAAWARRDHLDPAAVGDLRALLGWGLRPEDRAGAERVRDDWVVAGVRQGEDGRIVSQRTWLWGRTTGRWALVLDFAAAGAALRVAQPAGCVVRDELVVHQGAAPARAELSGLHEVVGTGALPAGTTVAEAVVRLTSWLAANPWRDRAPIVLEDVVLVDDRHGWWLQDAAGDRLAVSRRTEPWPLLALSGGAPATVTAEWEDGTVHPMAVGLGADRVPVPL